MILATVSAFDDLPYIESWGENIPVYALTRNERGMIGAYQDIYNTISRKQADIILYSHDDTECLEAAWQGRVEAEFEDPSVSIVGFGGAMGLGVDDIYKRPYEITQLQRIDYYSNTTDWEVHGKQETGARDVAVVDGFAMAVRTRFLDQIGGWKWFPFAFHMYDVGLCLMAHRHGWKVRMVGINCTHHGGRTSCSPEYVTGCRERGTTPEREHAEPHTWLYQQKWVRELLPLRIK